MEERVFTNVNIAQLRESFTTTLNHMRDAQRVIIYTLRDFQRRIEAVPLPNEEAAREQKQKIIDTLAYLSLKAESLYESTKQSTDDLFLEIFELEVTVRVMQRTYNEHRQ